MAKLDRRTFIAAASVAAQSVAGVLFAKGAEPNGIIPIIDSHIHLFDPNRPQGTPAAFPGPTGKSGSFPSAYKMLAAPLGVVGAIHIEASDWVEDNLWALETCAGDDIMVGVVGNLNPQIPEFREYLERYHRNPMFRGIRYGNIWGYDLVGQSKNRVVLDRLKLLAQADLVMDSATPNIALLQALLRVSALRCPSNFPRSFTRSMARSARGCSTTKPSSIRWWKLSAMTALFSAPIIPIAIHRAPSTTYSGSPGNITHPSQRPPRSISGETR